MERATNWARDKKGGKAINLQRGENIKERKEGHEKRTNLSKKKRGRSGDNF